MPRRSLAVLTLFATTLLLGPTRAHAAEESRAAPDYNRDVQHILSNYCYACHGPDEAKREASLRLDDKAGAFAELESGTRAIVPASCESSELVVRITADDESVRMPPVDFGKQLSAEQIETLRKWIEAAHPWNDHWSYTPVESPALPAVAEPSWLKTPIDAFILRRLHEHELQPSPEADRATLIRRLSFDLTGLPPTIADVDAFVADNDPQAYERLVDRLLASPQFGERMAQRWLDLARYADTNGYHIDNHRNMWRYREWVIDAFNLNLPFDQFTIEQLAGDLLPNATVDQQIAVSARSTHSWRVR